MSIEETVETPLRSENYEQMKQYEYKGKKYALKQLSQMTGLSEHIMRNRLYSGWSIEQVVETPLSNTYEYKGKWYTTKQLSQMTGLSKRTIITRLQRGWSVERVVETPKQIVGVDYVPFVKGGIYNYNGKEYSLKELSEISGISTRRLYKRIKVLGYTVKEAVEKPLMVEFRNKQSRK